MDNTEGHMRSNSKANGSSRPSQNTSFEDELVHHMSPCGGEAPRSTWNSAHGSGDDFIEHYFVGPRDIDRHSKWPFILRVHGSILPAMIVPLAIAAGWATLITCISMLVHSLAISSVLLTILGFVVALALSFRSSTGYERYMEGRRYWGLLNQTSRNLARFYWLHVPLRPGYEKHDLLEKISAINLILAFAIALKHRLRFEPHTHYEDLEGLVSYLDTFAKQAFDPKLDVIKKPSTLKSIGIYLNLPFAESNPQKLIKRSMKPVGNLPLEILAYISSYQEKLIENGMIKSPPMQGLLFGCVTSLTEVLTGCERVLHTPLPEAYTILFSQITWLYVMVLPFQLLSTLSWITIPATIIAAYLIIGVALIGAEVEQPFGLDVNDLPMDIYCKELAADLDVLTSAPPPKPEDFMNKKDNYPLFPLSRGGYDAWASESKSIEDIYRALATKSTMSRNSKKME